MGLKWNIYINVMEPNEEISRNIQQQQTEAELKIMETILEHYSTVFDNLQKEYTTLDNTYKMLKMMIINLPSGKPVMNHSLRTSPRMNFLVFIM